MAELVITCPDCATRYRTDTDAIGQNGRTVRCARCKDTWFVPAPDVSADRMMDADTLALQQDLSAQQELELEGDRRIVPPAPVGPATAVPTLAKPGATVPLAAPASNAGPTADVLLRDQADAAKLKRRRRTIRWIWSVAALLALAAVVTAYLNRQEIVNRQPQTATLYQAVGIEVREGGLEIDPPIAKTALVDGRPVIRVEGAVRNLSHRTAALPLIELTLHDTNGDALAQWFVEPSQSDLPGRGRLPFTTEYADPPEDVTGLRYRFAPKGFAAGS